MQRQELSQLLMIGVPSGNDLSGVRRLQPGGVILMGRNGGTRAQVRRLTRAIEGECMEAPLIATDQEGGRVQRLTEGFTLIPSARELGAQGANQVGIMASTVAAELRSCGVHVNFAPVCDVPSHPQDSVIADRAFSEDPIVAGLLAAEYVRGAQPTVMCVAKHFPGHGGVGIDSHKALPTYAEADARTSDVDDSMRGWHLPPFRAAIAAGVGGVMAGHMVVPSLDASIIESETAGSIGTPATLSRAIISGVLREEMKFRGVVFSDDLDMKALQEFEVEEIVVRAVGAGCDQLVWCHSIDKAEQSLDALERAVRDGVLDETRVKDAIERVRWAKRKFGVLG
jgi:beta-N-acetylhexosaminidase